MLQNKKEHPITKSQLHPRSKHRERYDFKVLTKVCPELGPFVEINKFGNESINFFNPKAVKTLNRALLKHHYGIKFWDIPLNYLCPPIPGRADYIHYIADLLSSEFQTLKGSEIRCLDIGVGANCIYPIIGYKEYGWSFVGSDIDPISIESAHKVIEQNPELEGKIEIRLQKDPTKIFKEVIRVKERFLISICNPPFHRSAKEAQAGTLRKLSNLNGKKAKHARLNFGGKNNELWCEGGEKQFVNRMIGESVRFSKSCIWFSTLVSKEANLPVFYKTLKKVKARRVKTIDMGQGNKKSRIIAWTFEP